MVYIQLQGIVFSPGHRVGTIKFFQQFSVPYLIISLIYNTITHCVFFSLLVLYYGKNNP